MWFRSSYRTHSACSINHCLSAISPKLGCPLVPYTTPMALESKQIQATSPGCPVRHPELYFEDGNLITQVNIISTEIECQGRRLTVWQVENTLFNVHRSIFTRHSVVFSDVFALPKPAPGSSVEGSSDEFPLQFPGISSVDFERLLWILYPPLVDGLLVLWAQYLLDTSRVFGEYKPQTVDEWTSVLHLATRWEFESIRRVAIRELEQFSIDAVDKIVLSRKFEINSPWTLAAYTEVCQRPDTLTFSEARSLGLETTMRIYQLREKMWERSGATKSRAGSSSPSRGGSGSKSGASENDNFRRSLSRRQTLSHPSSGSGRTTPTSIKTPSVRTPIRRSSDPSRLVAEAFDLDF